jgi:hypothetical protein
VPCPLIIVFYINAGRFEPDMPVPTFERGCIDPVGALEDPDYLEEPDYLGPAWTPGTSWERVAAVPAAEDWQPYRDFLSDIWEAIWEARGGQPVVLLGYDVYNPWFGQWMEIGVEPECTAIWEGQARAAREAAEANGAVFVSFYDLFNGPDHDEDARAKGWIGEDAQAGIAVARGPSPPATPILPRSSNGRGGCAAEDGVRSVHAAQRCGRPHPVGWASPAATRRRL